LTLAEAQRGGEKKKKTSKEENFRINFLGETGKAFFAMP
jgi:hypothetical protein